MVKIIEYLEEKNYISTYISKAFIVSADSGATKIRQQIILRMIRFLMILWAGSHNF